MKVPERPEDQPEKPDELPNNVRGACMTFKDRLKEYIKSGVPVMMLLNFSQEPVKAQILRVEADYIKIKTLTRVEESGKVMTRFTNYEFPLNGLSAIFEDEFHEVVLDSKDKVLEKSTEPNTAYVDSPVNLQHIKPISKGDN